jgi:hypothetical protein
MFLLACCAIAGLATGLWGLFTAFLDHKDQDQDQ